MDGVELQIAGVRPSPASAGAQPLSFDTNRGPMEAVLHPAAGATRLVLCVGGVGGGLEGPAAIYPRLGAELPAHGLAVLRLAYRRPGVLEECLADVKAVLRWAASQGFVEFALVGHSFGGEVVTLSAARDSRIAAVVAIASHRRGAIDAVAALAPRPLLLIHGAADNVVSPRDSLALYAKAGEPKTLRLFPNADHVLSQVADEAYNAVRDWLLQYFAPATDRHSLHPFAGEQAMAETPRPTPMQHLLSLSQGHFAAGALKAALELEIFTLIAHGTDTPAQLATAKKTSARGMRLLCDGLVGLGLLERDGERLSLPEEMARFLVKGSPAYMGGQIGINNAPWFWEGAQHLAEIVRSGHPLTAQSAEALEHPFWEDFERNSRQMAATNGQALAEVVAEAVGEPGPGRILDIACGSGFYGFSMLRRFPQARLVSFDYANVLRLTEKDAEREGLRERIEFRPGDLFRDDLGQGYDLVLACNIFQIYGPEKIVELGRRLYQATQPGGRLVVCGPMPDEERKRNRFALMFGMNMLIFTHEGDIYSFGDYRRMLEQAGFRDLSLHEATGARPLQAVVARK